MNAVARGASFGRERRGQGRHLHEARPHVNSWVRIRSRLRPRCWDIWCSSHLLRSQKAEESACYRESTRILSENRREEARGQEEGRGTKYSAKCRRLSSLPRGECALSSRRCFSRNMQKHTRVRRSNAIAREDVSETPRKRVRYYEFFNAI